MRLLAGLFKDDEAPEVVDHSPDTWRADPEVPLTYGEPEPVPEPAPADVPEVVRPQVVDVKPRKASGWSTWRATLRPGETKQLAGQHLGRTSLVVRNLSTTQDAEVGPRDDVTVGTGWPLTAGGTLTLENTGEVWATAAGECPLVVLAEYDVNTGGR